MGGVPLIGCLIYLATGVPLRYVPLLRTRLPSGDRLEFGYAYPQLANLADREYYHYLLWAKARTRRTYLVFIAGEPNCFWRQAFHTTADGTRLWVTGDVDDGVICTLDLTDGSYLDAYRTPRDPSLRVDRQFGAAFGPQRPYPSWADNAHSVMPPQRCTWMYYLVE